MPDELINTEVDDENEDLAALDRGDAVPEVIETERDEAGKFVKKGAKVKDTKVKEVKVDEVKVGDEEANEEDEEEEEEDNQDDEDEEEEDAKAKGKDKDNLPIRLNRAKKQRDRLAAELAETQSRLAEVEQRLAEQGRKPPEDPTVAINAALDTLYQQVEEARADGKIAEAAKLQREIDAKNRELGKIEASAIAERTSTKAQLDTQYDAMIDVIEAAYPQLVKGTEEYDPSEVKEFNLLIGAYERAGLTGPAALRKAVKVLYREDPFSPKRAVAEEVKEKAPVKKVEGKKTDLKKAVDTTNKQPPDISNRGVNRDDTKIDVDRLSDEEWDALPESKRRELRGDFAI